VIRALDGGLKMYELDDMYLSDIWMHIEARSLELERQLKIAEAENRRDFLHTRSICYIVYRAAYPKNPIMNERQFMPAPWEKTENTRTRIAQSPQEVWDDFMRRKAEREQRLKEQADGSN
jgi:hypothetical protein